MRGANEKWGIKRDEPRGRGVWVKTSLATESLAEIDRKCTTGVPTFPCLRSRIAPFNTLTAAAAVCLADRTTR
jgi:hypothetical protein